MSSSRPADETICAVATPPGNGAVGVVRLSGPRSLALLQAVSEQARFSPRRLRRVAVVDPRSGEAVDDALAVYMPGPRSYTGEDVVEISGHGGSLNMQHLLQLFVALGARLAGPGEFTRRAFINGRLDLTQAEAVAELIAARSTRALRNARATLAGALGAAVGKLRAEVIELAADLEACIDFADDVDAPASREALRAAHRQAIDGIEALAATYARGRRLGGVSVALVGPVNVGKSSLFNALVGTTRALVSEEEGTTRDYLEAELELDGLPVTLIDTAGERPSGEMSALERAGHRLGRQRVQTADLALELIDLTDPVARPRPQGEAPRLLVASKADLVGPDQLARAVRALGRGGEEVVVVSARTGRGLAQLREAVLRAALPEGDDRAETVQVTQRRQQEALCRAAAALREGLAATEAQLAPELVVEHSREALGALGEITGETFSEQVLDSVFSRFCIGK